MISEGNSELVPGAREQDSIQFQVNRLSKTPCKTANFSILLEGLIGGDNFFYLCICACVCGLTIDLS